MSNILRFSRRSLALGFVFIAINTNSLATNTTAGTNSCSSILPGGCYPKVVLATSKIELLKHAVPMKAGLWRDEVLDQQGKPETDTATQSCRAYNDWRKHALAAGAEAGEGCTPTETITRPTKSDDGFVVQIGTRDTCWLEREKTQIVSWLTPLKPAKPSEAKANDKTSLEPDFKQTPLTRYLVEHTTDVNHVSKTGQTKQLAPTEVVKTLHTWVGNCPAEKK